MNVVAMSGFICKNLKVVTTPGNLECVQFDLAVRQDFKNPEGKYGYDFPHIQSWIPAVNGFIKKYVDEGAHIEIEGKLRTRTFKGSDGKQKKIVFVNLEKLRCLDRVGISRGKGNTATDADFASMGQTASGEGNTPDLDNLDW